MRSNDRPGVAPPKNDGKGLAGQQQPHLGLTRWNATSWGQLLSRPVAVGRRVLEHEIRPPLHTSGGTLGTHRTSGRILGHPGSCPETMTLQVDGVT